jgi:hypothetical protein
MRRLLIAALALTETLVACAIFACSLPLSHLIARSRTLDDVASRVIRSGHRLIASTHHLAVTTHRIAIDGVRVHITISDA